MSLQPCLVLSQLPRAQAVGACTLPAYLLVLPAQMPSWQTTLAAGRDLVLPLDSATLPHMQQLCSPACEHFYFYYYLAAEENPKNQSAWSRNGVNPQGLTKGL